MFNFVHEASATNLSSLPREVMSTLLRAIDTLIKSSLSAVVGREDGVLEARQIGNGDVELAVVAALRHRDAFALGRDVLVEDERDGRAVVGGDASDAALRVPGPAELDLRGC